MNFVLDDVLDGGVNGSLNLDSHGKTLSSLLLSLRIGIDDALVRAEPDYAAESAPLAGDEGVFVLPEFRFESGEVMRDLRVGYVTHGRLNAARDNAVLLLPGTANTRHSADGHIGPGKAYDPDVDFIIAVEAIGSGTSSQPADGLRGAFPRYSIRDLVHSQHALVTQHFGLARLKAVVGASMGSFQALEWCIHYPDVPAAAVLLVPAPRAGAIFRSAVRNALDVVRLDAHWKGGDYDVNPTEGLRTTGRMYYPWTVTDDYMESTPAATTQREMQATVERAGQWDAWNFIRRYEASAGHDIAVPFGGDTGAALSRVRARVLVLPSSSERLLGIDSGREIASQIAGARYAEIPSRRGHLAWRAVEGAPETAFVTGEIRRFLNPGDTA